MSKTAISIRPETQAAFEVFLNATLGLSQEEREVMACSAFVALTMELTAEEFLEVLEMCKEQRPTAIQQSLSAILAAGRAASAKTTGEDAT